MAGGGEAGARQRGKGETKKTEKGASPRNNMKGVDRDMAQRILDQVVEL